MLLCAPGCAQPIKWVESCCMAPRKTSSLVDFNIYTKTLIGPSKS
jgi:hypothetical protein